MSRRLLISWCAAAVVAALLPASPSAAAPAASCVSAPETRLAVGHAYPRDVPTVLYRVACDGTLQWRNYARFHESPGVVRWRGPNAIGTGWGGLSRLFADGGTLYAITTGGQLRWYRYTGVDSGESGWAPGSGTLLDGGWDTLRLVTYAGNGVLYGVDGLGRLRWYRHTDPATGAPTWAPGSGSVISTGWGTMPRITAAGGTIYGARPSGALAWYRHTDPDGGAPTWAPGFGSELDDGGWDAFAAMAAVKARGGGPGVILHGVGQDGRLRYYHHLDPDGGAANWATDSGFILDGGWL